MVALMPPFQPPLSLSLSLFRSLSISLSLSYLPHTRKETRHSSDLTMYYISSSKTANLRPKKSMKKWLESLNPGSLTNWFCMTRLLVYDQQLRSFPIKSMATNHAQDTSHILLSSPINMDEFHERERRKLKKKGGKNPTKNHHFCHQPLFHIKPAKKSKTKLPLPYPIITRNSPQPRRTQKTP